MAHGLSLAWDLVRESTPQILVGTLFLAVLLAIGTAMVHRLIGRWVADPLAALAGLLVFTNLGAILIGACYVRSMEPSILVASTEPPGAPGTLGDILERRLVVGPGTTYHSGGARFRARPAEIGAGIPGFVGENRTEAAPVIADSW